MPLLNKRPFVRKDPSSSLHDKDKVFFCEITNEVFTDYDEYWERLVLCNAMVWTCELTGRPGLTYAEALDSELKAKKCLANLPKVLHKPMIYLGSLTRRGRYADMSDDVFNFVRDRYFVGEEVEAIVNRHWYDCKVVRVIYPTPEEVKKYEIEMADSDEEDNKEEEKEKKETLVNGTKEEEDEISVVKVVDKKKEDDEIAVVQVVDKKQVKKEEDEDYPPFATYKYEVVEIEPWDTDAEPKSHIVTWEQIRRNKGVFTREKCKLFLKQCVRLSPDGFWVIKDTTAKRFDLAITNYADIFLGEPPKFLETKSKKLPAHMNEKSLKERNEKRKEAREKKKREKKELREKLGEEPSRKGRPPKSDQEKMAKKKLSQDAKEGLKAEKREEIKQRLEKEKEDKRKEREIKKEEKRLRMQYIKNWKQKRDDLDCDDHKDLPKPTPINCRIPDEMFSEFIMILEFVNVFTELLDMNDVYPQGITFDMLEHALVEKEVAGVLNDLFQLLLQAIFTLQEEEDDEAEADTTVEEVMEVDTEDISIQKAVRVANRASTWSQQYHGVPIQKVPLDAFTLTEVLRLHILASGATSVANARWRHFNRGGFKNRDDPGLQFKLEEPGIIKALAIQTVFDLPLGNKMKILSLLVGQILTYASVRDVIDDNIDKLREMKNKLRMQQYAQSRKEKDEIAAILQEKREKRLKEREKMVKEAEKKAAAAAMTGEVDNPIQLELEEEEEEEEEEELDEEERAARLMKEEKNKEARKLDYLKREREMFQQILSMAKGVGITPLGQDRAFRRYWIFNSLSGLLVEDNEPHPGACRPTPTPYNPNSNPNLTDALEDLFREQAVKNVELIEAAEKEDKNNSDKENDGSPAKHGKSPNKKLLQTPNQNKHWQEAVVTVNGVDLEKMAENPMMDVDVKMESACVNSVHTPVIKDEDRPDIFGLCWADSQKCPVHAERTDRHKWYFFHSVEYFHTLMESLNNRGFRENNLKSNLESYKTAIENSIKNCQVFKLDPSQEPEMDQAIRKSNRNTNAKKDEDVNLNFPPGTPIDEILQLTLRDMILETEEKIHMGMLGSLRVGDRDKWREAIEQNNYLRELDPLDWGGKKRISQFKMELGLEVEEDDGDDLPEVATEAALIKDLAQAILQLGQSLDPKYLQKPLGETDKARKQREKAGERLRKKKKEKESTKEDGEGGESDSESEDEEDGKNASVKVTDNALRTPMERWEKSLMTCTNLSQLCLHYSTLDNSITWSRSALNARCRICRRKTDAENMLLCDECDKGTHIYCLKPKVKSIPQGNWYCDHCKPKEKPKSPRKKRQIFQDEIEEEEEESEENEDVCNVCDTPGTLICCDTCPLAFHQECAELRVLPRGNWSCAQCKAGKESPPDKKSKKEKPNSKSSKDSKANKEGAKKKKKKKKNANNTDNNSNAKNNTTPKGKKGAKSTPVAEGKKAKSTPVAEGKKAKSTPVAEGKKGGKSTPVSEKKRKNGATPDSSRISKKAKMEDSEQTTPKRSYRRSLGDEDSGLNSIAVQTLLDDLYKHELAWPFLKPVSKKNAPDYYHIVKKPMDLGKIREKLNRVKYTSDEEFIADVMLVFQNCQQYNMQDTDEYLAGTKLSNFFMKRVENLGLSYQADLSPDTKKRRH